MVESFGKGVVEREEWQPKLREEAMKANCGGDNRHVVAIDGVIGGGDRWHGRMVLQTHTIEVERRVRPS